MIFIPLIMIFDFGSCFKSIRRVNPIDIQFARSKIIILIDSADGKNIAIKFNEYKSSAH